jgi:hypothetical protein
MLAGNSALSLLTYILKEEYYQVQYDDMDQERWADLSEAISLPDHTPEIYPE